MNPAAIGKELTSGDDSWLRTRRRIAAIAGALAADFALIGMRQYGVIENLPDLPVRGFDSNAVITSPPAYPAGIPDSALAVAGLGGIIALATAGGSKRSGRSRWFDRALYGSLAIGAAGAVHYLDEMIRKQRRLCAYCIVGAAGFFAMATLAALPHRT